MGTGSSFSAVIKLLFLGLLLFASLFVVYTFGSVISNEISFYTKEFSEEITGLSSNDIRTIDTHFSIYIPKIDVYALITANVNLYDPGQYLPILHKGIAHVEGTVFPGQNGNVYLVAHSVDSFYSAGRYNADFYLLYKLEPEDEIYLYFENKNISYNVTRKRIIYPDEVDYFGTFKSGRSLTLQSAYPPGTFFKRLIIEAQESNSIYK